MYRALSDRAGLEDVVVEPSMTAARDMSLPCDEILAAVGHVVYDWSLDDDTMRWGPNALDALGIGTLDRIMTGRAFAALVDPGSHATRYDAIHDGSSDAGGGVAFQVQYSLLPEGPTRGNPLWIEEIGRWYAGHDGKPHRAHGVLRVINERHEQEQRLAYLARHDELTDCFNRGHLLETLAQTLAETGPSPKPLAFFIVSISNLRAINEAYGFDVAEQTFATVARRIKACLREGDAIGRFSSRKLGLMLVHCEEDDMRSAAERIRAAVRDDVIDVGDESLAVTVSIGGVGLPRHGRTASEAVANALSALHASRLLGSERFAAYAPSAGSQADRKLVASQSRALAAALVEGKVKLVFQPVVAIDTRKPLFYEALARVEHPDGAVVEPSRFIALAERIGLVRMIDDRVLELALDTLCARPDIHLSINVSAETIGDSEWTARLADRLAGRSDVASRLIVELTESIAINNVEEAAAFVRMLHGHGCRVAIDDFGAGFSSFRNLRVLAVDFFKIDGSFIENLPANSDDRTFVRALAELARSFKVPVVAEWVQDEETVALLADWGIDCIQGTLVGDVVDQPGNPQP